MKSANQRIGGIEKQITYERIKKTDAIRHQSNFYSAFVCCLHVAFVKSQLCFDVTSVF